MGDPFTRQVASIDADLRGAQQRKASARAAIERRQADMRQALADLESYERQEGEAERSIDRLLAERSRSRALAERCADTVAELEAER